MKNLGLGSFGRVFQGKLWRKRNLYF